MEASYKYFENRDCRYYPCHPGADPDNFNCLFCYCPMYQMTCPGNPSYIEKEDGRRIKDCSNCLYPHRAEHYEAIMKVLSGR